MNTDRIERETAFHDKRFGEGDTERKRVDKYYSVNRRIMTRYIEIVSSFCKGKELLEYGCGPGSFSESWVDLGAHVTGIDISSQGIKAAKEKATLSGKQANFYVMNAERTDFQDNSFDLVVGTGIIHHLDLGNAYTELTRIINPRGHAVFVEPLGHNPIINYYRRRTPELRTADEHPLKMADIDLLKKYFDRVEIEFYTLFTLCAVPFRNRKLFNNLYGLLNAVDQLLFRIPYANRLAWVALIHASGPHK